MPAACATSSLPRSRRSALEPNRLELEITEALLLRDTDAILAELGRLKALGVAVVMDDFGTGYSSLSYLWRFPFDKIKIDRAFMQTVDATDENVQTIIKTIVGLGHSLHMRVTVEGVEDGQQAAIRPRRRLRRGAGLLFRPPAGGGRPRRRGSSPKPSATARSRAGGACGVIKRAG